MPMQPFGARSKLKSGPVRISRDKAISVSPPVASAYSLSTLSGSALIGRAGRVSTLVPICEAATRQILKSR